MMIKFSEDVRSETFGAFDDHLRGSETIITSGMEWNGPELHCNISHGCYRSKGGHDSKLTFFVVYYFSSGIFMEYISDFSPRPP